LLVARRISRTIFSADGVVVLGIIIIPLGCTMS
jgi:hypothetical protein